VLVAVVVVREHNYHQMLVVQLDLVVVALVVVQAVTLVMMELEALVVVEEVPLRDILPLMVGEEELVVPVSLSSHIPLDK
tara:strand:+ start:872 stop:1111 length:240 start_codon:yes stop_codon:yes gene_type:complete